MTQAVASTPHVAVVGVSLCGVLAAIELRRRGVAVSLHHYSADHGDVGCCYRVPPTVITNEPVSGEAFLATALGGLDALGVTVRTHVRACEVMEESVRCDVFEDQFSVQRVLLAPHGSEFGALELAEDEWLNRGFSKDAASDAPLLAGSRVAVLGSGARAAEQALIAHRAGIKEIHVLCERSRADFGELSGEVESCGGIRVLEGVVLTRIEAGCRELRRIQLTRDGISEWLNVSWLFLARGLVTDLSRIRVHRSAVGASLRLLVGGLAVGIPAENYRAQIADAARLVSACLQTSI